MAVKHLTDLNVDGTNMGQSTAEKIGFYGVTPVIQPAATAQSALATTAITTVGSTTLTAADLTTLNSIQARVVALTTLVNQVRSDLVTVGVIKGAV